MFSEEDGRDVDLQQCEQMPAGVGHRFDSLLFWVVLVKNVAWLPSMTSTRERKIYYLQGCYKGGGRLVLHAPRDRMRNDMG